MSPRSTTAFLLLAFLAAVPAHVQQPIQAAGETVLASSEQFEGTFARYAGATSTVTIVARDNRVFAQASQGGGGELLPEGDAAFRFAGGGQSLRFNQHDASTGLYNGFALSRGAGSVEFTRVEALEAAYLDRAGQTRPHALSDAVLMGDLDSAKLLIDNGADPTELDTRAEIAGRNGRRPLNWAAQKNNTEMIQLLLDRGVGIDLTNNGSRFTALHHAAEVGSTEAAQLLIERGASLDLETTSGHTAFDIANLKGHSDVAAIIQTALEERDCAGEGCPPAPTLEAAGYTVPASRDDGLVTGSLAQAATNSETLIRLLSSLERGLYNKVDSLLIIKDGVLVVEQYYNGWDVDRAHPMQSVSKSITSLLVGSAIFEGHIKGVDEPISKYLPKYTSLLVDGKEQITIEDLLTMSAGFDWNEHSPGYTEPGNIRMKEVLSKDAVDFTLTTPFITEPGTTFTYSGGYVTIAGQVIANATDSDSVLEAFEKSALRKLGFENHTWQKQADGRQNTAGGVALRPRDLAKIGQLMLNDGTWNGERVLSKEWVTASLEAHLPTPGTWNEYGYYWWGQTLKTKTASYSADAALGYGGQELILVRDLGLVVVLTATNYQVPTPTETILTGSILPAFE